MHILFFSWLILPLMALSAGTLQLKEKLEGGKVGDFVVTLQDKNYTLWHIKDKQPDWILIEEISAPQNRVSPSAEGGWQEWVTKWAPRRTQWMMYAIYLPDGIMTSIYSVDHQRYLTSQKTDRFFATLLNVPFNEVSVEKRKKTGPKQAPWVADRRPYWNPPLVFEGKQIQGIPFSQYLTKWPKDGSDLSGKSVEIFLPQGEHNYPDYLPYWMEISGAIGSCRIRIIDSGRGLKTPPMAMWPREEISALEKENSEIKPLAVDSKEPVAVNSVSVSPSLSN